MAEVQNKFKNWLDDQTIQADQQNRAFSEDLRSSSLKLIKTGAFPTRKDEEWRYTPLKEVLGRDFHSKPKISVDSQKIESYKQLLPKAQHLVFLNGVFSQDFSDDLNLQSNSGLTITHLSELGAKARQVAEKIVSDSKFSDDNIFQHAALALAEAGLFIEVKEGCTVDLPLHLIYLNSGADSVSISSPVNVFQCGLDSQFKVIQYFDSLDDAQTVSIPADYVNMEKGSILDLYKLGLESQGSDHISNAAFKLGTGAELNAHQYLLGSGLSRTNIEIEFDGPGGRADLRGIFSGDKSQHLDIRTYVDHAYPNCSSNQHFRGIMNDHSRGVFNGLVLVQEDAQKTDAVQSNKNLLLSRDARVDTKPQLEIFADDVKCSHGATVGELDENALFYLQSRGIGKQDAALMLTKAFAAEITDEIAIEPIKQFINDQISIGLNTIGDVHV